MANTGNVKTDQLFKGLTRPAMLFGVSYIFSVFNLLTIMMLFVFLEDLRVLFILGPIIHGAGYIASTKEPLFVELFMIKMQKCSKCLNRFYHGTNSYDIT
ncbi:type IV secretion system protein VirB3 [Candidatus Mesenet endosymbiont of Phosphuga atrata]|uniref:type IV secretion system protein VirB3 n=1 Tax=Candidatus Mesenet endosymbiont of Phosphuga atrata TaxID=3066221 RepID=UPI0030CC1BC2